MIRPSMLPGMGNRYQRAFQDGYEGAIQHWRIFLVALLAGMTALFVSAFIWGDSGRLKMRKFQRETARLTAANSDLARQVEDLKAQGDLLTSRDFVLEKLVRENMRLVRPGEMLYLFDETPENAGSTAPVIFDEPTIAKRPPKKEQKGG